MLHRARQSFATKIDKVKSRPIPPELDLGQVTQMDRAADYRQIMNHFLRLTGKGDLKPGDPIPSGPRLAEYYGVSYLTVRHAMELLQERGVVQAKQGVGTTIHPEYRPPPQQTELLAEPA
jgi:DNA-binding GntR family transcriptional regulator